MNRKSAKNHYTLVSAECFTEIDALLDATKKAKNLYKNKAQAVHIVFVNLIQFQKKWKAVVSVTVMDDIDGDGKAAIIFGHLPEKYSTHYDDLLPEVDHLNVIHDVSIWRDIKKFLLDLHFYQAVHFGEIQRITESGGGRFAEKKKSSIIKEDLILDFNLSKSQAEPIVPPPAPNAFQQQAETLEALSHQAEYDIILRNQREGISVRNLVFKMT